MQITEFSDLGELISLGRNSLFGHGILPKNKNRKHHPTTNYRSTIIHSPIFTQKPAHPLSISEAILAS